MLKTLTLIITALILTSCGHKQNAVISDTTIVPVKSAYDLYLEQPTTNRNQYFDICTTYFDQDVYDQTLINYYSTYQIYDQQLFLQTYCITYKQAKKEVFLCHNHHNHHNH